MAKPKIVIFTQPDCPPCQIVKLFLSERSVAFEEKDISIDPAAVRELTDIITAAPRRPWSSARK